MSSARCPLPAAATRRILADLKRLQEEPLPLAAAAPCSDQDLSLWDGVIGVEMEVTHMGRVTVPLHFLIDFPTDYPQSAPSIGFSFEFQYTGGASYIQPDGRLQGKKVICLDVLGNFGHVHTEWKGNVGSGWSPAYTVTTLLVQLQSVLCDLGTSMDQRQRDVTYQSAVRFCERNPSSLPELLDEEEIQERKARSALQARVAKICGGDEGLAVRVRDFMAKSGLSGDRAKVDAFLALLSDVASHGQGDPTVSQEEHEPTIDRNICCFATGRLYTEAMLGVGVSRERKNLGTAGELLSKDAFDGGLRQSTNKSPFEFFLPVWINRAHAADSAAWRAALQRSVGEIGRAAFQTKRDEDAAMEVFPRLINQMIVEMMRPDAGKSEAIATFEALCNFWRTFRWIVDERPAVGSAATAMLARFTTDEVARHKDNSSDLGMILVLYTVLQRHEGCPSRQAFIDAYVDENPLRWVMWWQKPGTAPKAAPVF